MAEALRPALRSDHRDRAAHRLEGRDLASRASRTWSRARVAIIPEPGYNAYQGGTLLASGEPYRYRCGRARTSSSSSTRSRATCCGARASSTSTTRTIRRPRSRRATTSSASCARCRERDILLVYDNAYSELAFDGYVPPSIFEIDGARDVAIEFHSLSKTYNMTGWRCGWAVARPRSRARCAKVKSFVDTGQFMAIQAAGVAALESWDEFVPRNVAIFQERRDAAVAAFRAAGFACEVPRATMYLWIPLPEGIAERAVRRAAARGGGRRRDARLGVRRGRRRILPHLVHHVAGAHRRSGAARGPRAAPSMAPVGGSVMTQRRPSGSLLVSVAFHAALAIVLANVVLHYDFVLRARPRAAGAAARGDHVRHGRAAGGRARRDDRERRRRRRPKPPRAARRAGRACRRDRAAAPQPAAGGTPGGVEGGTGVGGGSGPTTGIVPGRARSAASRRRAQFFYPAYKTPAQRADSAVKAIICAYNDSVGEAAALRGSASRATGRSSSNGKKWGVDGSKIYLGKFWIPSAVLAALPIRVQGNPGETIADRLVDDAPRRHAAARASRSSTTTSSRPPVKRIRERKDRERREKQRGAGRARACAQSSGGEPLNETATPMRQPFDARSVRPQCSSASDAMVAASAARSAP